MRARDAVPAAVLLAVLSDGVFARQLRQDAPVFAPFSEYNGVGNGNGPLSSPDSAILLSRAYGPAQRSQVVSTVSDAGVALVQSAL